MKVAEDAAQELPLNDERLTVKPNRHIAIALNHLRKRREVLVAQNNAIQTQLEEIDAAIKALE